MDVYLATAAFLALVVFVLMTMRLQYTLDLHYRFVLAWFIGLAWPLLALFAVFYFGGALVAKWFEPPKRDPVKPWRNGMYDENASIYGSRKEQADRLNAMAGYGPDDGALLPPKGEIDRTPSPYWRNGGSF